MGGWEEMGFPQFNVRITFGGPSRISRFPSNEELFSRTAATGDTIHMQDGHGKSLFL